MHIWHVQADNELEWQVPLSLPCIFYVCSKYAHRKPDFPHGLLNVPCNIVLFPDRKTFSPEKSCQCEGQKCLNEFSNYLLRSSIKSSTLFLQTAWTVSTLIHIAAGHLTNLADNSLDKVECTAHQLGSGGVAGIMSVIMHLLSVKGLAGATFHQNRVCWGCPAPIYI